MKTTKKANPQQGSQQPVIQPRLVKADERAAREAARAIEAERKAEAKAALVAPALLRTPRNANEARSMFEQLFGDKAA